METSACKADAPLYVFEDEIELLLADPTGDWQQRSYMKYIPLLKSLRYGPRPPGENIGKVNFTHLVIN